MMHSLLIEIKDYSLSTILFTSFSSKSVSTKKVSRSRRKKRDLSGMFANLLFGPSSNESPDQINAQKLQTIKNWLLIDKHTELFGELLDVLNNTIQFQNGLHATLQKNLSNLTLWLENASNQTTSAIESHEFYIKFTELSFITMFSMLEFRENQRHLFEAIQTKTQIFHLIPPKVFKMKLREVSLSNDAQGFVLPMPLNGENLPKFYEITTTTSEIVNKTFMARFSIPLAKNSTYFLYKATSVPHRTANDIYNIVVPHYEYIAVDNFNSKFVVLTANEMKKCHRINSTNWLCHLNSPINTINKSLECEINLLQHKKLTSNCELRTENVTTEFWMKLEQPNTYLYTLPKTTHVVIECFDSNESLYLMGGGIITLKSGCKIQTDQVELITFHNIEANISYVLVESPKFNVSSKIANDTQLKMSAVPSFQILNITNEKDWIKVEVIKFNLRTEFENAIDAAEKLLNSVVHANSNVNNFLLSFAAIVVLIATIYVCLKYSLTAGVNVLIFVTLLGFATAAVLYIM